MVDSETEASQKWWAVVQRVWDREVSTYYHRIDTHQSFDASTNYQLVDALSPPLLHSRHFPQPGSDMKFGIFYEHQIPRPWNDGDEHKLFKDALAQVELADRLGIDYIWEVEHHFLEEYSHSSAPEVFLAACSQRTRQIRLGHGIVLMPPGYNHPARVAERIATLDLISDGRVDWGTGESSSRIELEGFDIDPKRKHDMWEETVRETARMMAAEPYPGFEGRYFSMPHRNVVPKPLQKPHPPIWVACSNRETIKIAARMGIGALTFAFVDADEARHWVSEYYDTFERECEPVGLAVNPTSRWSPASCATKTAKRRSPAAFRDFSSSDTD